MHLNPKTRSFAFLGGLFLLLVCFQPAAEQAPGGFPYAGAVLRATVKIRCLDYENNRSEKGAGVLLRADGLIVTNYHNVDLVEHPIIEVTLYDGRTFAAILLHADAARDLALLKIPAEDLSCLRLGDSSALQVGEAVYAVGHPHYLDFSLTSGIVSAFHRRLDLLPAYQEELLQTDVPVNTGCSGGPLLNRRGELVGINTAIVSNSGRFEGYALAIPVEAVRLFLNVSPDV